MLVQDVQLTFGHTSERIVENSKENNSTSTEETTGVLRHLKVNATMTEESSISFR